MPRFYFDVDNGPDSHSDDTGIELDRENVVDEASKFLTDLARDEMPKQGVTEIRVSVRDQDGHGVYQGELTLRSTWNRDE